MALSEEILLHFSENTMILNEIDYVKIHCMLIFVVCITKKKPYST